MKKKLGGTTSKVSKMLNFRTWLSKMWKRWQVGNIVIVLMAVTIMVQDVFATIGFLHIEKLTNKY